MAAPFRAVRDPAPSLLESMAARAPSNPFVTPAYAACRRRLGGVPWALYLENDDGLDSACLAFMRAGRLNRELEITSLPAVKQTESFWRGVRKLCARERVSNLFVRSYGSTTSQIPSLRGESARHARTEFVIDLNTDFHARLSSHHRRAIDRARKRTLTIRRRVDREACETHAALFDSVMQRRHDRGQEVPLRSATDDFVAMTASGAGEVLQMVNHDEVLSSLLVLKCQRGAYLQSAGTSAEGLSCGSSPLLIHEACHLLQREGATQFNLGGVRPDEEGLRRFKSGFGAQPIELESADFCLAGAVTRALTQLAQRVRPRLGL